MNHLPRRNVQFQPDHYHSCNQTKKGKLVYLALTCTHEHRVQVTKSHNVELIPEYINVAVAVHIRWRLNHAIQDPVVDSSRVLAIAILYHDDWRVSLCSTL